MSGKTYLKFLRLAGINLAAIICMLFVSDSYAATVTFAEAKKALADAASSLSSATKDAQSESSSASGSSGSDGITSADKPAGQTFKMKCNEKSHGAMGAPKVSGNDPIATSQSGCIFAWNVILAGTKPTDTKYNPIIIKKLPGKDGEQPQAVVDDKGKTQWDMDYKFVIDTAKLVVNNWKDPKHELGGPLIPRGANSKTEAQNKANATNKASSDLSTAVTDDQSGNPVINTQGGKREFASVTYSSHEQALSAGICQMIHTEDGNLDFTTMKDGTLKLQGGTTATGNTAQEPSATISGATKKESEQRAPATKGDYEAILYTPHPFGPREVDWQDLVSPSRIPYAQMAEEDGTDGGGGGGSGGGVSVSVTSSSGNTTSASTDTIEQLQYHYTWVCGKKNFPMIGKMDPAWKDGFDYYTKPLGKNGKILANTSGVEGAQEADKNRHGKFQTAFPVCFWPIWAVLYEYVGDPLASKIALETCEYSLCRAIILPPVTPINRLKMGENLAPEGPGSYKPQQGQGGGGPGGIAGVQGSVGNMGPGQMGEDGGGTSQPPLYEQNRAGYPNDFAPKTNTAKANYADEGMSFYFANPSTMFGYNMPPIKHLESGQPVSNTVIEATGGTGPDSMAKWETWRTVIAGVNSKYAADASDGLGPQSHNMSAQYGGWNELILYQKDCQNGRPKVACICDWQKSFYEDTALGYAMFRTGSKIPISNEEKLREQMVPNSSQGGVATGSTRDDSNTRFVKNQTAQAFLDRYIPVSMCNDETCNFKPFLRGMVPMGGKLWPGQPMNGQSDLKGLANAKKGDILILRSNTAKSGSSTIRPDEVVYVEEVRGDKCLRTTTKNRGVYFNSYEGTEKLGLVEEMLICPDGGTGGGNSKALGGGYKLTGVTTEGSGDTVNCDTRYMAKCTDKEEWEIYRWMGTNGTDYDARGFSRTTGQPI